MFLITYRCSSRGREIWGYCIEKCPMKWVENMQEYQDEVYFLINALPISDEFAARWDGELLGT